MQKWQKVNTGWLWRMMLCGLALVAVTLGVAPSQAADETRRYSVWLLESSRFVNVPFGSFVPDRAFIPGSTDPKRSIPTVDLPLTSA